MVNSPSLKIVRCRGSMLRQDERAFAYTYDTTLSGTLVNSPTLGSPYPIPAQSSILVIGDSWANEEETLPSTWGDFPAHMRRFLRNLPSR